MKHVKDPGLGIRYRKPVNRLMNADGTYNIERRGVLSGLKDFYKYLTDVHWAIFSIILIFSYLLLNVLFALLYLSIGVENIVGFQPELNDFENAFFFSSQTFTTLGYGALHPKGLGMNLIATLESFTGLIAFAIATGLLWGRFAKPSTKIAFSKNIIITDFEEGKAVMFKMVNQRNNVLLKTKVKCIFTIDKGASDFSFNKDYFELNLETDFVLFFPLTWTLVHKIDGESPVKDLSIKDLIERNAEVVILVETFDETYSQTILQKHSYAASQWLDNVRFERNFESNEKGKIVLNVKDIDRVVHLN